VLKPNLFDKDNGDELHLEAFASVGTAAQNAAWSPLSLFTFQNVVDDAAANIAFRKKADALPADQRDELKKQFDTLEKFRHFKKNEYGEPNEFLFKVESESHMSPEYLVFKSFSILCDMLHQLAKDIRDKVTTHVEIQPIKGNHQMYNIVLHKETHTLGNVIQACLYNKYVRDEKAAELEYIGYYCPHPLEPVAIVKTKFHPMFTEESVGTWLVKALNELHNYVYRLCMEWVEFSQLDEKDADDVGEFMNALDNVSVASKSSRKSAKSKAVVDNAKEETEKVAVEEKVKKSKKTEKAVVEEEKKAAADAEVPVVEEKVKKSKKKTEDTVVEVPVVEEKKVKKSKKKTEDAVVEEEKKTDAVADVEDKKVKKSKKKTEIAETEVLVVEKEKIKKTKKASAE